MLLQPFGKLFGKSSYEKFGNRILSVSGIKSFLAIKILKHSILTIWMSTWTYIDNSGLLFGIKIDDFLLKK